MVPLYRRERQQVVIMSFISELIELIVPASLISLSERKQKPARWNAEGWRVLHVGWSMHSVILCCVVLIALMGLYLWASGQTRPDAETQSANALLVLIGTSAVTLYLLWSAYGRTIMWKGEELRVRTIWKTETVYRIADVSSVTKSDMRGEYRLTFQDGSILRLSAHLHGAKELIAKLPCQAPGNRGSGTRAAIRKGSIRSRRRGRKK